MSADLIERYFELVTAPDQEAWFGLFADDAVVQDDGNTHVGIAAIRAWRSEIPPVTYTLTDAVEDGRHMFATADVAGSFPGSPIEFGHRFGIEDGQIRHLTIAPAG